MTFSKMTFWNIMCTIQNILDCVFIFIFYFEKRWCHFKKITHKKIVNLVPLDRLMEPHKKRYTST